MKRLISTLIALGLILSFSLPTPAFAAKSQSLIPTFSIIGVAANTSVTIRTYNFPAGDTFKVLMGYMGTRGVNGYYVTTIGSGGGGSFTATFNIPAALFGQYQIAIRLQSITGSGYYAYNWFYNNTTGGNTGGPGIPPVIPGFYGYPTFSIASVVANQTVTIVTNNLPPNDTFQVTMGPMGTKGIYGYVVTTINSAGGGTQTLTFNIPPQLSGSFQISIRLQSISGSGYYAYNWFYNNTTPW
jgi:hypothetical protein